jgi:hypothetical protein
MTQTPQETLQDTLKRLYSKDDFLDPESLKKSSLGILYTTETPPKEAMTEQEFAELHPYDGEIFEFIGFTQEDLIDQVVGLGAGTYTEEEIAAQVLAIREGKYDI